MLYVAVTADSVLHGLLRPRRWSMYTVYPVVGRIKHLYNVTNALV